MRSALASSLILAAVFLACGRSAAGPKAPAPGPAAPKPAPVAIAAAPADTDAWVVTASLDSAYPQGKMILPGSEIRTTAVVQAASPRGTMISLSARTRGKFELLAKGEKFLLRAGRARIEVLKGTAFEIATPVATSGVRGTDFAMGYEENAAEAEVAVFEGAIFTSAGNREELMIQDQEAAAGRGRLRLQAMRDQTRDKFSRDREKLIDALMDAFGIVIEGDTPDLKDVLKKIPNAIRDRIRENVQRDIQRRRQTLQEAATRLGAYDTRLPPLERLRRARDAFDELGLAERNHIRKKAEQDWRKLAAAFRKAADDTEERWGAKGETVAATFRKWAAEQEAVAEKIAASREPTVVIEVAGGGRRVVHQPLPQVMTDHPLRALGLVFVYEIKVGPLGAVREIKFIHVNAEPGKGRRELEWFLRQWRFDEIPLKDGVKTYRVTLRFVS